MKMAAATDETFLVRGPNSDSGWLLNGLKFRPSSHFTRVIAEILLKAVLQQTQCSSNFAFEMFGG
jgi:hypothetical protein